MFYYQLGQVLLQNWGNFALLQIGTAFFYYKLGQVLLQIGAALLLQIRVSFITNQGSYYKLEQPLLQIGAAIANWGKLYYKLGQLLQIGAIITNWGITASPWCKIIL